MQWEYKAQTLTPGKFIEDALNRYGAEGWELVTAHVHHYSVTVYLKRPKVTDNYGK